MISNVSRVILAFNLVQNTKKMLWTQQVKAEVLLPEYYLLPELNIYTKLFLKFITCILIVSP